MPPKIRADIDLDALRPPDRTVKFRGVVYMFPSEVPLDTVLEAIQIYEGLNALNEGKTMTPANQAKIMHRLEGLIMGLLRERNPEIGELRLGATELGTLLASIIVGAGTQMNVDDAVAAALTGRSEEDILAEKKASGGRPPTPRKKASRATPSASRSRAKSSG